MEKLEKLFQSEEGHVYHKRNDSINCDTKMFKQGKIKILVVEHPCVEISDLIDSMAEKDSKFIPNYANAYIVSEYSPDTQFLRKSESGAEKFYSVYAIQFYHVIKAPDFGGY